MKYTGGCHCGQVQYEVDLDLKSVISCNCSMCQKKGTLLTFAPIEKFKLLKGEDSLKDYQFNKKVIHHYFCKNCGVTSFAKGTSPKGEEMSVINVRCLENVDISKLEINHVSGKDY